MREKQSIAQVPYPICYDRLEPSGRMPIAQRMLREDSGAAANGGSKFTFRSSSARLAVINKPVSVSVHHKVPRKDKQQEAEEKMNLTKGGLQLLFQNYESDEED